MTRHLVNANDVVWTGSLTKNDPSKPIPPGAQVYQGACSSCHGLDRKGSPPEFPSLVGIGARMSEQEIRNILTTGRGRMPPFPGFDEYKKPLIDYLLSDGAPMPGAAREIQNPVARVNNAPYRFTGYRRFTDPDGYPAVKPPWGTLNAIDLNTGRYLWKVPLGEYPELVAQGLADTGSENYGGPVVTAGGLVIIGATKFDRQIRAFDRRTGSLLWRAARDPKGPRGSAYVAFALPQR